VHTLNSTRWLYIPAPHDWHVASDDRLYLPTSHAVQAVAVLGE